jgi:hypothetical protein
MHAAEQSLYRIACRLHRELSRSADPATADRIAVPLMYLEHAHRELAAAWRRLATARRRGWHLAANRLQEELWPHAQRLERCALDLLCVRQRPAVAVPGVDVLLAELRQLREEFDGLQVEPRRRRLTVRTGRIVLRELDLGPFEVGLRLDRLARLDASCFDCVALEPRPAAGDSAVTHPHVKDAVLCTGDAAAPIAAALRQGRLVDAFLLLGAVLNTYNPQSPYIALEEWEGDGSSCAECGDAAGSRHLCFCEDCERAVCEACMSSCEVCDDACCRSCLERDRVSDTYCCAACRRVCEDCGRTVDANHADPGSGLCPACLQATKPLTEEDPSHAQDHEPVGDPADDPVGDLIDGDAAGLAAVTPHDHTVTNTAVSTHDATAA